MGDSITEKNELERSERRGMIRNKPFGLWPKPLAKFLVPPALPMRRSQTNCLR
jgi:hypothetical protein